MESKFLSVHNGNKTEFMIDEIMDGLMKFGNAVQVADEVKRLTSQNRELNARCGNCEHWMKKSECPREAKGDMVSMGRSVCDKFAITKFSAELINKNELRISELIKTT